MSATQKQDAILKWISDNQELIHSRYAGKHIAIEEDEKGVLVLDSDSDLNALLARLGDEAQAVAIHFVATCLMI